jgi:type II secretory pathway component PulC
VALHVERSLVNEIANDLRLLQARIVPVTPSEGPHGFRLFGVRPHTLAGHLGLANGDHVIAVNGSQIGDLDHARSLFEQAIRGDRIELVVERRGARWTLSYLID